MLQTPLPLAATGSPPIVPSAPASRSPSGVAGGSKDVRFDATLRQFSGASKSPPKIDPKDGGKTGAAAPETARPTPERTDRSVGAAASKSDQAASISRDGAAEPSGATTIVSSITAPPDEAGRLPIMAGNPGGSKSGIPSAPTKGKTTDKSGLPLTPDLQPPPPIGAFAVVQPMPVVPATPVMVAHITQGQNDALSAGGPNPANPANPVSVGSPPTRLSKSEGGELAQTSSGIQGQPGGSSAIPAGSLSLGKISLPALAAHHNAASVIGTPMLALAANSGTNAVPTLPAVLAPAQPAAPNPASAQLSAALVASGPLSADGAHQLTIALAPPAIGPVTVAINRGADGTARIAISAVDPVTLSALRNDHAGITQALAQAGITAHESAISFQLASHAGVAITPITQATSPGFPNSGAAHHPSEALSTGQGAGGHQSAGEQSMGQQNAGQSFGDRPSEPMPFASRTATLSGVAIGADSGISSIHSSNLKKFGLDVTA